MHSHSVFTIHLRPSMACSHLTVRFLATSGDDGLEPHTRCVTVEETTAWGVRGVRDTRYGATAEPSLSPARQRTVAAVALDNFRANEACKLVDASL